MSEPEQVLGLIVQNANAHHSGFGLASEATKSFWTKPTKESEEQATEDRVTSTLPGAGGHRRQNRSESWEEDWKVMQLPGRMATQRALIADYGNHVPGSMPLMTA